MSAFILDCSVAMAWLIPEETSVYADAAQDALLYCEAFVPTIWHYEVANVLTITERRKRITSQQLNLSKSLLSNMPIQTDQLSTDQAQQTTLQFARDFQLTAYDAAYLELASRKNLPLATLDKALKKSAKKLGIEIFEG